jgi:hypothetical protein
VVTEGRPAVHEQPDPSRYLTVASGFGGEHEHGRAAAVRPVHSGVVGDRHQGLPGVGGAVLHRHIRFGPFERGEIGA